MDANAVLNRLKTLLNIKHDTKLARYFGVESSTVYSWRKRNTLDCKLIMAKFIDHDYNYIFKGTETNSETAKIKDEQEQYGSPKALQARIDRLEIEKSTLQDMIVVLKGK